MLQGEVSLEVMAADLQHDFFYERRSACTEVDRCFEVHAAELAATIYFYKICIIFIGIAVAGE